MNETLYYPILNSARHIALSDYQFTALIDKSDLCNSIWWCAVSCTVYLTELYTLQWLRQHPIALARRLANMLDQEFQVG